MYCLVYPYPELKSVMVCGDIHGDFDTLEKTIVAKDLHGTLIIVAGDCGLGFKDYYQHQLELHHMLRYLKPRNCCIAMIRGNHDDPSYFAEPKLRYYRYLAVPDNSILQCAGHTILVLGGAVSTDRYARKAYMRQHPDEICYWPNENVQFGEREKEQLANHPYLHIDTVVTHSAPSFCPPKWKEGLKAAALRDPLLIRDCEHERKQLDELHHFLVCHNHPIKQWFYGHFHQSDVTERDGIRYTALNELEITII